MVSSDGVRCPLGPEGVGLLASFLFDMRNLPEGMLRGVCAELGPKIKFWLFLVVVPKKVRFWGERSRSPMLIRSLTRLL